MLMVCGVKVGKAIEVYVRRDRPTEAGGTVGGEAPVNGLHLTKPMRRGMIYRPTESGGTVGEAPINGLHLTKPMRRGMIYHPMESGGTVGRRP